MPGPCCFLPHHFYPQINESLELTCYLFTLHQTPRPRAEDVWDILNLKIFTLNVSNLQLKEKIGRQMSYITSCLCILYPNMQPPSLLLNNIVSTACSCQDPWARQSSYVNCILSWVLLFLMFLPYLQQPKWSLSSIFSVVLLRRSAVVLQCSLCSYNVILMIVLDIICDGGYRI